MVRSLGAGAAVPSNASALSSIPPAARDTRLRVHPEITLLDGAGMVVPMDAVADPQFAGDFQASPYFEQGLCIEVEVSVLSHRYRARKNASVNELGNQCL